MNTREHNKAKKALSAVDGRSNERAAADSAGWAPPLTGGEQKQRG